MIILAIIIAHDQGFLPLNISVYTMRISEYGDSNEIQSGALAGDEPIQYRFIYQNSDTLTYGEGTRIINLFEKKPLSLGLGSIFPFYRNMRPETIFTCEDVNSKRNLGEIRIQKKVITKGLLSYEALKQYLQEKYHEEIITYLDSSRTFIDENIAPSEADFFSISTKKGDAQTTVNINLGETEEPIRRRIKFKRGVSYSRDSLLFSTYQGADTLLHHEIVIVDKNNQEMVIERYFNNGNLALRAHFEEPIYPGEEPVHFQDREDGWRTLGGLSECGIWEVWSADGQLRDTIDYSKR